MGTFFILKNKFKLIKKNFEFPSIFVVSKFVITNFNQKFVLNLFKVRKDNL